MKLNLMMSALICLGFSLVLTGCTPPEAPTVEPGSDATTEAEAAAVVEEDSDTAGLAKLSPEDAESALAQKVCLVSDEPLGSMGAPIKVAVEDQEVWICCEGCRDQLLAKSEDYLAKLNAEDKSAEDKSVEDK